MFQPPQSVKTRQGDVYSEIHVKWFVTSSRNVSYETEKHSSIQGIYRTWSIPSDTRRGSMVDAVPPPAECWDVYKYFNHRPADHDYWTIEWF